MRKRRNRNKRKRVIPIVLLSVGVIALALSVGLIWKYFTGDVKKQPPELLMEYMDHISRQEYDQMYEMIHPKESGNISREEFVKRNSAIYEGIEIQNLKILVTEYEKKSKKVSYTASFDTLAGNIEFENEAVFIEEEGNYRLQWKDSMIFPELGREDKIKVTVTPAERGRILDRNGQVLAGKGTASLVGIVPGKTKELAETVKKTAELLETEPEVIEKKLSAKWVKQDSFVPIKMITKVDEMDLMKADPEEGIISEYERQERLLEIPGVMITDTQVRDYPLAEAAAHLVGYVQNVTAEDLEKKKGQGYTANSVIGRTGVEALFEQELKGENGCLIEMTGSGGVKRKLAEKEVRHGQDIRLTIDGRLQTSLYEQFAEDKGCSVALNPNTGEVLAMVSTPSYDNQLFIMGMSDQQWKALNEDEKKPLYNRFRQAWCPGSTMKPITGAVGLETESIDPLENFGDGEMRWQKDSSWGAYYVTTLHTLQPANLENSLICSDNVYFAKAALKIGRESMENSLKKIGFHEDLPFEISMAQSRFSNTEKIETEIQLADSGYGQGQILVNPLHLASIYTAFCNEGTMKKPYLVYEENPKEKTWVPNAFSGEVSEKILEGLKKVINDPRGTGAGARIEGKALAGKTGTAEIKASKDDRTGTELGWFVVFTMEKTEERPIMIVSMAEDVKDRGGSGYVLEKDRKVLENWFAGE